MRNKCSIHKFLTALLLCGTLLVYSTVSPVLAVDTTNGFVKQEKSNWCWAASSVSMLHCAGYSGSNALTQTQVSQLFFFSAENVGRATADVYTGFRERLSLPVYLRNSAMSASEVERYVNIDSPIYSEIAWSGGGGHIVVISGYTGSGNSVRLMDPLNSNFIAISLYTLTTNYSGSGTWIRSMHYTN